MPIKHVLFLEPFLGGSHRLFVDHIRRHSRHQWTVIGGKAVHWKWRMRCAPLEFALRLREQLELAETVDVILCSSMLDLPSWRGLLGDHPFSKMPTAVYFHENQWMYPEAPGARIDHHYGYTNLLTAICADSCFFNSAFQRTGFLDASVSFVRRMPDNHQSHDIAAIEAKSTVIAPGFDPPAKIEFENTQGPDDGSLAGEAVSQQRTGVLRIGWVARWEYDKRPDRFLELLTRLETEQVDFELILLGPRPAKPPTPLQEIRQRFGDRILFDGFAKSRSQYWQWLTKIDVVVSTAEHEFFGIAVCEAIWAGAAAVLPRRLSYPELIGAQHCYDSMLDAEQRIQRMRDATERTKVANQCRQAIERFKANRTIAMLDDAIDSLVLGHG